jgi:neutral ceramidase
MAAMMKVGAAESNITPPVGTALAGYFEPRFSEGVIYDLMAKAVIAGEGDQRIGIVACDLIALPKELVQAAREVIERETGIPGGRVLICGTHTHTGPETRASRGLIPPNEEYLAGLPARIAQAAIDASRRQKDCVLRVGRDQEEGLAFIRRFRMRDGSEQFGPGEDLDQLAGVAGTIDPELGVLAFAEPDADPFAVIVNYSLHIDVTSGNLISADYPAVITETLRKIYGEEVIVLFVNGACGNINHVPYLMNRPWPYKGVLKSRQIGRALGGKAIGIIEKALPCEDQTTDIENEMLEAPFYPWDDVLESRLAVAKAAAVPNFFEKALLQWAEKWNPEGTQTVETQTLRFGDAVFCSAPGELFVEWGKQMKQWSPHPYTFIAELANDSVGYIPTFEAFRRGGYEATPVVSVKLTPALGQLVTDANFRSCWKLWERKPNKPQAEARVVSGPKPDPVTGEQKD